MGEVRSSWLGIAVDSMAKAVQAGRVVVGHAWVWCELARRGEGRKDWCDMSRSGEYCRVQNRLGIAGMVRPVASRLVSLGIAGKSRQGLVGRAVEWFGLAGPVDRDTTRCDGVWFGESGRHG